MLKSSQGTQHLFPLGTSSSVQSVLWLQLGKLNTQVGSLFWDISSSDLSLPKKRLCQELHRTPVSDMHPRFILFSPQEIAEGQAFLGMLVDSSLLETPPSTQMSGLSLQSCLTTVGVCEASSWLLTYVCWCYYYCHYHTHRTVVK